MHCGRLVVVLLQFATDQKIEFLICAAQFEICFQRNGVISLHQGVQKFVDGDRLAAFVALAEIVPLEHARHVVPRRQPIMSAD